MIHHHDPLAALLTQAAIPALILLATSATSGAQCAVGLTPVSSTPMNCFDLELADVDRDGDRDVLVASSANGVVHVLLNDGTGALAPSPNPPIPVGSFARGVSVADFDGVNGPDLLVAKLHPHEALIFYNDGSGGFTPGPVFPLAYQVSDTRAADLDGRDGIDVITVEIEGVAWYLADGSGGFGPRQFRRYSSFPIVQLGDFDGGNGPDLAIVATDSPSTGYVDVLLNTGSGSFVQAPGAPYRTQKAPFGAMAVGQLDGAPGDEIVFCDGSFFPNPNPIPVNVLVNNGAGSFTRSQIAALPPMSFPEETHVVDFDGSGAADIVMSSSGMMPTDPDQGIRIYLNDGTGNMSLSGDGPIHAIPNTWSKIGDLDGQLGPDFVASTGTSVEVLLNGMATAGVSGQNLLRVYAGGTSLAPAGVACPTIDLSNGGSFAFDVEGRAHGLSVALLLQLGECATRPAGVLPFGSIPGANGYTIPANCAAGSNRILNVPIVPTPIAATIGTLAFDAARGVHVARLPFSVPAGAGTVIVAAQAVVLDAAVPGGFVLSNALDLRL